MEIVPDVPRLVAFQPQQVKAATAVAFEDGVSQAEMHPVANGVEAMLPSHVDQTAVRTFYSVDWPLDRKHSIPVAVSCAAIAGAAGHVCHVQPPPQQPPKGPTTKDGG